jgi:hypothetical protein
MRAAGGCRMWWHFGRAAGQLVGLLLGVGLPLWDGVAIAERGDVQASGVGQLKLAIMFGHDVEVEDTRISQLGDSSAAD